MSKTYNLRKALQTHLTSLCDKSFFEINNSDKETYPYLVWDLSDIGQNYQLELNIYDYGLSSRVVDELTDTIESYFKRFYHKDSEQVFWTVKNERNKIEEEDKQIRRRRLLIDLYYIGKEE